MMSLNEQVQQFTPIAHFRRRAAPDDTTYTELGGRMLDAVLLPPFRFGIRSAYMRPKEAA